MDDQKRVMTPEAAIRAGANYLVVGRPIRDATDPPSGGARDRDGDGAGRGGAPQQGSR